MRIGENARIFFSEREKSVPAMRVTTLVNKLIGLQGLWVRGFHFQADKARVVVDVVPRRRKPLCGICGRKVRKNKDRYNRYWRHLDLFGVRTYLLDPTSGMSAVWSGQRKGALGRQGKPLYQKRFSCRFGGSDLCWRAWPMDAAAIVENAGNSGGERRLGKGCEHVQTWSGVFHNRLENASRFPRAPTGPS